MNIRKGKRLRYKGKRVKVVEPATGYVGKTGSHYWVEALEPVDGFNPGEQITVTTKWLKAQLKKEAK